ncbi:MAG: sigma-70 family RNA polymerase sigma factor [Cyclobacteriaceae bacterium]|nr:sigma-70 family RNA polymerase sigma factor [Cyclobacteriaceae bacterium HetDA_MAG_MS6]
MFGKKAGFDKEDLKNAYDEYFPVLRNFLYYKTRDTDLSEDLVQEVFIKVWEKRDTIRKDTIKSLLYTMANNLLMNHFNHLKVIHHHEAESGLNESEVVNSPEFVYEEKEFEVKLNMVLQKIPDGSREVFLMNRIDKLKYDEIAKRLEISVKAVEKRMSKALAIIKEELGRKI